jgi:outer membrane lipoprotein-sorting protein
MRQWIFLFIFVPVLSFSITADDIIKNVDRNQVFDSQKGRMVMVIDRDGKKMMKEMISYGVKEGNKFFVEFTNPEDKGVKYLKLDNELWIYLPDADDIMKISGHMLRQGMMGSDISYEDMMNDEEQQKKYHSVIVAETNVNGTLCYDIELTAKVEDGTYNVTY